MQERARFCRDQPDWQYNLHNLDERVRLGYGTAYPRDAEVRENAWEQMAQAIFEDLRNGRTPVTVDHVFDNRAVDELVGPARAAGYAVRTWLVATESADLCVARVLQRAAEGGHGSDPSLVEQMYEGALYTASELSTVSDVTYLIDNTGVDGFMPVARIERFAADVRCEPIPEWAGLLFLSTLSDPVDDADDADSSAQREPPRS